MPQNGRCELGGGVQFQPHGDRERVRDVPQRDDGAGQTGDARGDDAIVRDLSQVDDLVFRGDVQPYGDRERVRELPQRDDGDREIDGALCYDAVLRVLPPSWSSLDTGHHLYP